MARDDRAADRQPHAQSAGFGAPERLEEPVHVFRGNAGSAVAHRDQNLRVDVSAAYDDDPIREQTIAHRIESVQEEVQERPAGTGCGRRGSSANRASSSCETAMPRITASLWSKPITSLRMVLRFERPQVRGVFLHERPDPTDDLAGAGVIVDDVVEDVANFLQVRVGGGSGTASRPGRCSGSRPVAG